MVVVGRLKSSALKPAACFLSLIPLTIIYMCTIGHSCLVPLTSLSANMKALYVFVEIGVDAQHLITSLKTNLEGPSLHSPFTTQHTMYHVFKHTHRPFKRKPHHLIHLKHTHSHTKERENTSHPHTHTHTHIHTQPPAASA